ncbi:MAG: ATPase [Rikenellaceae bacterium]|nr:ATPase [Rikenellaceae bacterium]
MSTSLILAYVGVVLMVGVSGLASAVGTARCGMAAVGALKKNSGAFGSYMILSALPGSQGLYGFVGYFMVSGYICEGMPMITSVGIFGAGLLMAIVCLSSAIMQSKVCANGIAAIGNGNDVMGKTLILAAFPELYAILGVAATFLISSAISTQGLTDQKDLNKDYTKAELTTEQAKVEGAIEFSEELAKDQANK